LASSTNSGLKLKCSFLARCLWNPIRESSLLVEPLLDESPSDLLSLSSPDSSSELESLELSSEESLWESSEDEEEELRVW